MMHELFNKTRKYSRRKFTSDVLAGLTGAVAGAPQAMGFAIVAGVSPVYGLYSTIIATIIAAFIGRSAMITVGPTNALALVIGTNLMGIDPSQTIPYMAVITLLTGLFQFGFGLLRLGDLTRFVSNAVMTGFISGAGLLILIGQLDHLSGYAAQGGSIPERVFDWFIHLPDADPATLFLGILSIIIIYYLHHTRLKSVATLVAIMVNSTVVLFFGLQTVEVVGDVSGIPAGLPPFQLPAVGLIGPQTITIALALAVLGSVQSAAIIQAIYPKTAHKNINRDFTAHGISNIAGGFFLCMPSGGSLGRTAVNLAAGAATRMANVFAGVFIAVIVMFFGPIIEQVTLTALAGHLIVAASSMINLKNVRMVWQTYIPGRIAMTVTFLSTLILPLEYSIYFGVTLSLGIYLYTSAAKLTATRLVRTEDNHFREEALPPKLPDNESIIINVEGNLFFAAVRNLEDKMPDPTGSRHPVVILRLRDNYYLGTTGIQFLERYTKDIRKRDGLLILTGIEVNISEQLERSGMTRYIGPENIFPAGPVIFNALEQAVDHANQWLSQQNGKAEAKVKQKASSDQPRVTH